LLWATSAIGPQFGTIFDFPGTISATSLNPAPGLSVSTTTPLRSTQAIFQSTPDSATIPNVVTAITGSFTPPANSTPVIYQVMITSTLGGPPVLGTVQSGQTLKNAPGDPSDNTLAGNTARIEGPSTNVVPEPGTLLLLSAGLVGVGGYVRLRLRRQR
jgi:PEP-CTERM motif